MARAWRLGVGAVAVLAVLGLGACSDDEPPTVSQEAYQEEVARLCTRHVGLIVDEYREASAQGVSDAEEAGVYRSSLVPRLRALLREIRDFGFPAADALQIQSAINQAADALNEIDDDAPSLIDRRRDGRLPDDDNPFVQLLAALNDAGFGCAAPATGWEFDEVVT